MGQMTHTNRGAHHGDPLSNARRRTAALALACLILPLGLACTRKEQGTAQAEEAVTLGESRIALPVAVVPAQRDALILTLRSQGIVRSDATATLKAETAGTVLEVPIHAGAAVRSNDIIVRLDPTPLEIALSEAEAAVGQARVQFLDLVLPDSLVTGRGPDSTRRAYAIARAGLPGAEARLARARLELERSAITAPFSGIVDRVAVAPGERVAVGQELATVVNLDRLRVEANVLEHDLPLIRPGASAIITVAADPTHPVTGRVTAVLPLIDTTTRAARVVIQLPPQASRTLRPGMSADVRLEAGRLADRLLVPAAAVIERDGRPLVFVARGGKAQWVYINPGRSNGAEVEVRPDSATGMLPLQPGDSVLIEGHLTLTHDAPIRVITPDGPDNVRTPAPR